VIDQWKAKKKIRAHFLDRKGQFKNGKYKQASDNADAFSIIE
jgi:hypothetical protein